MTYSKFKRVEAYCIIHNVVVNIHLSLRVPLYLSVTHVAENNMKYRAKAAACLTFGSNGGKSRIAERKVVEK